MCTSFRVTCKIVWYAGTQCGYLSNTDLVRGPVRTCVCTCCYMSSCLLHKNKHDDFHVVTQFSLLSPSFSGTLSSLYGVLFT